MRRDADTRQTAAKGGLLSRLLLILGILLLVIALSIGGYIAWQYLDAQNRYRNIESVGGLDIVIPEVVDSSLRLEDLLFDWDALRALNPEVVGWIIVPGTNINYPIVQGTNNEYYLYHLFDASSSGTGAIFADYEGSSTLNGKNNIIYGHNMFDGSMFSDLYLFTNQDYFDSHRTLFLCTPGRIYELCTVALIGVPEDAPLRQFDFEDEGAFLDFINEMLASPRIAATDMQELIAQPESVYSFVTCETFDFSKRVILCTVPVRSVEPANAE